MPAFAHARGLLQFNQYHKYTVDEHCIRAVEAAAELACDPGPLGRVYRADQPQVILHLALLIHDLGKGFPKTTCEVGTRIAAETAARLELAPLEAETLRFLVLNHQMMGQLAFRRDTSDEQLVVRFAVDVGSPELLAMLFVLTAADTRRGAGRVGRMEGGDPRRAVLPRHGASGRRHHGGHRSTSIRAAPRCGRSVAWLGPQEDPWFLRQLDALPAALPRQHPAATDRRGPAACCAGWGRDGVLAQGQYLPETDTLQYTVATREDIVPGIFHRLTGALTSRGLGILSAQINTLADGLVIDRFWVFDPDYSGQSPPERIDEVCRALAESLPRRPASRRLPPHVAGGPGPARPRCRRPKPG